MTAWWIKKIVTACAITCITIALLLVCIRLGLGFFFPSSREMIPSTGPGRTETEEAFVTEINLPLSIPLKALGLAAEKYVPKTYIDVDDDPTDLLIRDHLIYDLKRGPITMALDGSRIHLSFPVSGTVKLDGKVNLGVATIDTSAHGDVEGIISGDIAVNILPDWRLKPDLQFKVKILKASIPVKRIGTISLRTFLEDKLARKINRKKKKLNAKVMDKTVIREKVTKLWEKMHRTRRLNKNPDVWATIVPLKAGFMSVAGDNDDVLHTGIKLTLATRLYVRTDAPSIDTTKLPNADILKEIPGTFKLNLPFQIETATLNRYIENRLVGVPREVAKNIFVTVKRAELVSSGRNKLSAILFADVEHTLWGLRTSGRFYVNGIMVHDKAQNIISIKAIHYDAALSRWWVRTLHWAIYPYLIHKLENQLVMPIGTALEKAHDQLIVEIEKLVVPEGIKAKISVNTPTLISVEITRKAVSGKLALEGTLDATLDFPMPEPYTP